MDLSEAEMMLASIGKELQKDPNNWEAWAAKADILYALGMHNLAIRCCDKSLEINKDNPFIWFTRSLALRKIGEQEQSDAALSRARELGYKE